MEKLWVVIIFVSICAIFSALAATIFYHVMRYNLVGDSSKRGLALYVGFMAGVVFLAIILVVLNHLIT